MRRFLLLPLTLLFVLCAASASADDPRVEAEATYERAAADDDALRFPEALAGYERSLAISPSHRYAQRAATRVDFLHAHAEGGFVPLAKLEAVRRRPGATRDATMVDALARDAESFPPGSVRAEARFVVGEAYLTELARPEDAERELRAVVADDATPVLLRKQAAARLVDRTIARADLDDARRLADLADDRELRAKVKVAVRRRGLHRLALATLGAFALLALGSVALRRRGRADVARFVPWALVSTAWIGGASALLASRYEHESVAPFLAFAAALLPIALAARAWSAASPTRTSWVRAGRALLAAAAVLGAAFLVLERIDPRYLEGFGL